MPASKANPGHCLLDNLDSEPSGTPASFIPLFQADGEHVGTHRAQHSLERDASRGLISEAQLQLLYDPRKVGACSRVWGKSQQLLCRWPELTPEPHCRTCPEWINASALETGAGAEYSEGHRGSTSSSPLSSWDPP